jgi:hypothetical protein
MAVPDKEAYLHFQACYFYQSYFVFFLRGQLIAMNSLLKLG